LASTETLPPEYARVTTTVYAGLVEGKAEKLGERLTASGAARDLRAAKGLM
jgi:hypothetical protein